LFFYSLDGISAYVEEIDLPEYHDDTRKPGGHWGSFVCHDFIKLWTGEPSDGENAKKLCGRWSAFDHEGHGTSALETVPWKAMVDSCQDDGVCKPEIFVHVEMDGGIIGNDFIYKTNSTYRVEKTNKSELLNRLTYRSRLAQKLSD
jgi:hypothetical protein